MRNIVIAFFVLACWCIPATAQQPLTRADSADVLMGTAERLRAQESAELAEALARLVARRYADTPAAARAATLLAAMNENRRDRSGRVELIAWSTLYGAWLGVAVPAALGADGVEAYGLGLIAGAPLGFAAARGYSGERSISAGDARAITFGGTWGTWQGAGWQMVLDLGDDCDQDAPDIADCSSGAPEPLFAMMVGGGLAGVLLGAIVANNADVSAGTATLVNFGALWGSWYGVVLGVLADADSDDELLTAALLAGNAGLVGTALLAPRLDMSRNRARLVNAGGVIGLLGGAGMLLIVQPDDDKVGIMLPAAGSALGLWLGAYMTRNYDDDARMREGRLDAPGAGADALVRFADGDWQAGVPRPSPLLLRADGRSARAELGLLLPLLEARF